MYQIFFIHFSVDGHLGCFHVLAIVNIPAMKPKAIVDTTGAGDTLCGNFVAALVKGNSILDSVKKGICASTKKLEVMGAQPGMPYAKELEAECQK